MMMYMYTVVAMVYRSQRSHSQMKKPTDLRWPSSQSKHCCFFLNSEKVEMKFNFCETVRIMLINVRVQRGITTATKSGSSARKHVLDCACIGLRQKQVKLRKMTDKTTGLKCQV